MKQRNLYYRRKGKSLIIEGKARDGSSVSIWTLPAPEKLILQIISKASFFSEEKAEKILLKINRLAIRHEPEPNSSPKVPLGIIMRSPDKDALTQEDKGDEDIIEVDDDIVEELGIK